MSQTQSMPGMAQSQLSARDPLRPPLLARYAENIYWLARYMERIENLAWLLDVTRTFANDQKDGRNWLAILRINADEDAFDRIYKDVTAENVTRFYLLDPNNPSSIASVMEQVRENARSLRAMIAPDIWAQINVFHAQMKALTDADIGPQNLSTICAMLKDGVHAHTGVMDGMFYRDQSWSFYAMGRYLERADQMTRLVDIKYAAMLPADGPAAGAEAAQWAALLRAAGGYQSYRRVYLHSYSPADVARFLLLDSAFPRSVDLNLSQLQEILAQLRDRYRLQGGRAALERLNELRTVLSGTPADELVRRGLSPFLDWMQRQLATMHSELAQGFFFP